MQGRTPLAPAPIWPPAPEALGDFSGARLAAVAAEVPLQRLHWPELADTGVEFWVRRDDLLPGWGQGNKFYKLFFNLAQAPCALPLASFGGAYSNHLHALALLARQLGRPCVGFVRGERPAQLSATLCDAQAAGMRLVFLRRDDYRSQCQRQGRDAWGGESLWFIPEGGANLAGARGCRYVAEDCARRLPALTEICLAAGTGTSLAGMVSGSRARVLGVSVLKGAQREAPHWLGHRVAQLLAALGAPNPAPWQLLEGRHHGGYARATPALLAFMADFEAATGVPLEPVYTAKLCWAVRELARQGRWQPGQQVLLLHSGGLQGRRGFPALG